MAAMRADRVLQQRVMASQRRPSSRRDGCWKSRVEPSMSVKRKVTVPLGRALMTRSHPMELMPGRASSPKRADAAGGRCYSSSELTAAAKTMMTSVTDMINSTLCRPMPFISRPRPRCDANISASSDPDHFDLAAGRG